jgi:repressor LexA
MNKLVILNNIQKHYGYDKDVHFAGFLGIPAQNLSKWKSRSTYDAELIYTKCPEINPEYLLTGEGEMLKDSSPKGVFAEEFSKKGIPMLPFDAFAGIGDSTVEGVNFETIEERYIVPLFDGIKVDFMLPVRGSSMYPKYSSGDVVACRLVTELLFVQWNKVYVIDSISQGVIMKRLLKGDNNEHLICRSDNKEYGEFPVPMTDIRSIALVVGVIRLG